jgi:hypothetical protein
MVGILKGDEGDGAARFLRGGDGFFCRPIPVYKTPFWSKTCKEGLGERGEMAQDNTNNG